MGGLSPDFKDTVSIILVEEEEPLVKKVQNEGAPSLLVVETPRSSNSRGAHLLMRKVGTGGLRQRRPRDGDGPHPTARTPTLAENEVEVPGAARRGAKQQSLLSNTRRPPKGLKGVFAAVLLLIGRITVTVSIEL